MKRMSELELPNADELRIMIQKESPRLAVKRDYLVRNAEVFDKYREVALKAEVDISVLDCYKMMSFDGVVDRLHVLTDRLERFLRKPKSYGLAETLYQPLNCTREPERSDLILVFGSAQNLRINKAIDLYQKKFAPKIMTTGAAPHWKSSDISEGDRVAQYAINHGIPESDIIVENRSIATPDNVKRSIDMLEKMNWQPHRIVIVTSEFNARRAHMDVYKFIPWEIQIYSVSPEPSEELNKHNWIKTERGRRIILNEYAKLIIEDKIDQILEKDTL